MNVGLHAALYMGVDDIHFWGMDLSYPFGQSHCEGTTHSEVAYQKSSRLNPTSAQEARHVFLRSSEIKKNTLHSARPNLSQSLFHRYKQEVESTLQAHPDRRFMNHSAYGVPITGTHSITPTSSEPPKDSMTSFRADFPLSLPSLLCSQTKQDHVISTLKHSFAKLQQTLHALPPNSKHTGDLPPPITRLIKQELPFLEKGFGFMELTMPIKNAAYYKEIEKLLFILERALL